VIKLNASSFPSLCLKFYSIYIERDANTRTRTFTSAKKNMCAGCSINGRDFFSASPGCCRCLENSSDVQFIKNQPFSRRVSIDIACLASATATAASAAGTSGCAFLSLEAPSVFTAFSSQQRIILARVSTHLTAEARASPPSMSWHSRSVHQSHRQVTVHHLRITSLDPPLFRDFHSTLPGALSSIMSFPPSYTPSGAHPLLPQTTPGDKQEK
jgi:hypothetical protein